MSEAMSKISDRYLAIMKSVVQHNNSHIESLDAFKYLTESLQNEASMKHNLAVMLNDLRRVQDRIKGKVIVDAGCGGGAFTVLLSVMGAGKVYAVDYMEDCVEVTRHLVKLAGLDNVEVIQSDIGELAIPDGSADGIFSIEAISHYRNYVSFLEMAARVLNSNGFMVIRDGNNAASPVIRRKNFAIWDTFENDPRETTVFGHKKGESCYKNQRKEIIATHYPSLSQEEVDRFAVNTFSYSTEGILQAVSQFVAGDTSLAKQYSYGSCPLDPLTDCFMEQMFDPRELKRQLKGYGFRSKIISSGPAKEEMKLLRVVWEALSPITIFLPRGFHLIADRLRP